MSTVENFTAIGNNSTSFSGTFDGGGHTISNLTINNSSSDCQALFGLVGSGTVKNVTVKNANVSGHYGVSAVVAYNNGTVSNCYELSATVSGSDPVGGVVDHNNGTVSNCYYYDTTPESGGTKAYKLTLPAGVTLAEGSKGVYYDGAVYAAKGETITLTSKFALAVDGTKLTSTRNNTYTYTMTASDAEVVDFLGLLTKDTADTSGNTYLITTAAELQDLATYVNGGKNCKGLTFKLANDIDLKDVANFTATGKYYTSNNNYYFSGTFDGDGHTISNLTINNSGSSFQGLFGAINGTVKNVTVKNAHVNSFSEDGAVVGLNYGTVSDCYYYNTTPKSGGTEAYKLTLSEGVTATGGATFTVDGVTYYSGTFTISGMVVGSTITLEGEGTTFTETSEGLTCGSLTLTGLTKSTTTAAGWSLSDSTATYNNDYTSAGYQLAGNQINYVNTSGARH